MYCLWVNLAASKQPAHAHTTRPARHPRTCDVVSVKACCVKLLDGGVEGLAHLQQVVNILVHQTISTQHVTDLWGVGGQQTENSRQQV